MSCRLIGAKSFSEPMLECVIWDKLQWYINENSYIFTQVNAIEQYFCKMPAICLDLDVLNQVYGFEWWRWRHFVFLLIAA